MSKQTSVMSVDLNKAFFTSDLHFGHENIIKFCDRPFLDGIEMDNGLVDRWNAVVPKDGITFILGDLSFHKPSSGATQKLIWSLNGTIHLILGNHDDKRISHGIADRFESITDYLELKMFGGEQGYRQRIIMSHFPMLSWHKMQYGSWMLHGHCHGTLKKTEGKLLDVGVDNIYSNYHPLSFVEIRRIMDDKNIDYTDYHGTRHKEEE